MLYSCLGEIISTKRDDVELINLYFNIQVNNPVTVLNQDTARTFIKSATPKDLYSIFVKGTHLEEIEQRHLSLKNEKLPFLEEIISKKNNVSRELFVYIIACHITFFDIVKINVCIKKFGFVLFIISRFIICFCYRNSLKTSKMSRNIRKSWKRWTNYTKSNWKQKHYKMNYIGLM